jgi:hypothetical protein
MRLLPLRGRRAEHKQVKGLKELDLENTRLRKAISNPHPGPRDSSSGFPLRDGETVSECPAVAHR